jgi:hypothetical protein
MSKPFATIEAAVEAAGGKPGSTILLRAGTHFSGMSTITAAHQTLTIQNYNGEHAIVSGGVPIPAKKADWKPFRVSPQTTTAEDVPWKVYQNENNVYGRANPNSTKGDVVFLGLFLGNVSEVSTRTLDALSLPAYYTIAPHMRNQGNRKSRRVRTK